MGFLLSTVLTTKPTPVSCWDRCLQKSHPQNPQKKLVKSSSPRDLLKRKCAEPNPKVNLPMWLPMPSVRFVSSINASYQTQLFQKTTRCVLRIDWPPGASCLNICSSIPKSTTAFVGPRCPNWLSFKRESTCGRNGWSRGPVTSQCL